MWLLYFLDFLVGKQSYLIDDNDGKSGDNNEGDDYDDDDEINHIAIMMMTII